MNKNKKEILKMMYDNNLHNSDVSILYSFILDCIIHNNYNSINDLLDEIQTEKLNSILLVGIPRILFSYQSNIPNYKTILDLHKKELEHRNLDPNSHLKGLI